MKETIIENEQNLRVVSAGYNSIDKKFFVTYFDGDTLEVKDENTQQTLSELLFYDLNNLSINKENLISQSNAICLSL